MLVLGEGWQPYTPSSPTFSDVLPGDWFYSAVETAYSHGIVGGYADGTFRPYNEVTRGQLSKMLVLAQGWPLLDPETGHFFDVARGSAFYVYVETALSRAIISGYGDGTFRPGNNATRGQLSKMLYSALSIGDGAPGDASSCLALLVKTGPPGQHFLYNDLIDCP
jgi:hypothetical protein